MDYNKKRWTVLIVSCIINIVIGTGYAWSVFAGPWAEVVGKPAALAFTVCNAVGFITMIAGGKINDMLGPKWVVFVGGVMFGGGAFLAGFSKTLGFLVFTYGIIFGLGMGLVYSCTIGNTVKFFPDKKGMVGGLTTATYGLGSVILAPVANAMVNSMGVATTFKILGIVYLIVICVGAFLITACPAGFLPEGYTPPAPVPGQKAPEDKTWSQMIKDPIFYVLFIMLVCGAFFGLMMISQCKAVATGMIGMEAAFAATIVSVLALFNAAGRVLCGFISDKIGRINTLTACLVLAVVGLALVYKSGIGTPSQGLFIVGICFVGFCFGSFMGVYPGFTAEQFGMKNNGVNYGIMFIAFSVAGVLGPMIMQSLYTSTGSYSTSILIALVLAIVGFALNLVYRALSKKN
jgi:MFS family permease